MNKKAKIITIVFIIIIGIAIIISAILCIKNIRKRDPEDIEEQKNETIENNTVVEEFVEVLEDGTRLNTSSKLDETKKFEGLEISNLQITEKDNVTLLLGTITNVSQTKQGGYPINIKLIDKDGNEIITIVAIIGELEPGESTQLSTNAISDFANAYDFIITRK